MSNERADAEEHLRIIRSLMERATVYRAISAPTALFAGSLSILAASAIFLNNETGLTLGFQIAGHGFVTIWLIVLLLALGMNAFFIRREASAYRPAVCFACNETRPAGRRALFADSHRRDHLVLSNRISGEPGVVSGGRLDRFLWFGFAFHNFICAALARSPGMGFPSHWYSYSGGGAGNRN